MNRLFYIIVFVLVSSLCFVLGRATKKDIVTTQVKEVVIRDTLRFETPTYIYRNVIDTMFVPIEKTIRLRDTLYLSLPMERRVYGSDDFYAEVTGYKPSLDYIEVFPKTKVVTKYVKGQERWRFSLDAGMDVGKGRQAYIAPNIGAEMGYMRWSVTAEAGLDFSMTQAVIPYYQIGLRYAIIQR